MDPAKLDVVLRNHRRWEDFSQGDAWADLGYARTLAKLLSIYFQQTRLFALLPSKCFSSRGRFFRNFS